MRYSILLLLSFAISIQLYALNENEVYCYIKQMGIKHPEVVLRQAIYESGHFKSKIFKAKHNLFGFRHNSYIKFDSWKTCIEYYKRWQEKYYKDDTVDYYRFLQKRNFSGKRKMRYDTQLKRIIIRGTLICEEDGKRE
jgi:uncharacterized FlgJ-related protein